MAEVIKVALIQTELIWQDPQANRQHISGLLNSLSDKVDLIILPEMFTTGFTMNPEQIPKDQEDKTVSWMSEWAGRKKSAVAGSIIANQGGKYYNRFYFVTPDGERRTYDKRHTFTLAGEDKIFTRGTDRLVIPYLGFKICPMICYDLRFPVWSRNTDDFDVLIYAANWPSARVEAWDILLKARAIENMVYCIGVNRIGSDENGLLYAGHSAVYDSLGEALVFSDKDEILLAELDKNHLETTREQLKFLQDRDSFNLQ
ncbi:MAG: amidohydrolase [Flavobacteriaceae bacterium]